MSFTVFNSLSGKKEPFQPADPNRVRIYNCGPTVYNFNHIGNFRAYIFVDQLRRYLRFRGYGLDHASNITDVDDKIIDNALKEGKSIQEFTGPYVDAFLQDLETLRIETVEHRPRATEHIETMLDMIGELEKRGHTYSVEGNVYFKLKSFPEYGKLSRIEAQQLMTAAGGRFEADEYDKEDVRDFALWKAPAKKDEPAWDSPWGAGRPGWHLECSAMIRNIYGKDGIDIHTGGIDLLFPHHENEIAQSCGAYPGENFVRYWMHNEHLLVESKKMSKSLGNFFTLRDLTEKEKAARLVDSGVAPSWILDYIDSGWMPLCIRYLLSATHYRNKLNFTFEGLKAARTSIERIQHALDALLEKTAMSEADVRSEIEKRRSDDRPGHGSARLVSDNSPFAPELKEFLHAMDDDLNISRGLAAVFEAARKANTILQSGESETQAKEGQNKEESDSPPSDSLMDALVFLAATNDILGVLRLQPAPASMDAKLAGKVEDLIEQRAAARKGKDFARADAIREELTSMGIEIKDTPEGTKWHRI
ncbi:MAG: cysteine--tRNA ligase [Leptospiraceae bacterium]|nr:cysteine--tRNA ligase [Leptospiraceae bacterium]